MPTLIKLNLPAFEFRIRATNGRDEIFDLSRKRYVSLTNEEWVRQHIIVYLHFHLKYPLSLIAVEKKITINTLTRRFDIAVYGHEGKPLMLVECKAPEIKINQAVIDQAGRYNLTLNVPYLCVTNGLKHLCCRRNQKDQSWEFLDYIPSFQEL